MPSGRQQTTWKAHANTFCSDLDMLVQVAEIMVMGGIVYTLDRAPCCILRHQGAQNSDGTRNKCRHTQLITDWQ